VKQPSQADRGTAASLPSPAEVHTALAPLPKEHHGADVGTADKVPAASALSITPAHTKFSDDVHSYVREHIRNADQKATFFFAAFTGILAFLNARNVSLRWLKNVRLWSFVDGLAFLSMLGLSAGAIALIGVVFPRLKGSRRGFLFFNAIAEYDNSADYASDVLASSPDSLTRMKLQHCYDLSLICTVKYRALKLGFWLGFIGAASALLFLFLSKTPTP
jgi:hypothetical protein